MVTYIKLFLTACFWGGTFIAGKVIAPTVHPFCASFLRFAIASTLLIILVKHKYRRFDLPTPSQAAFILLLGATGVFAYNYFFFTGLKFITAGRASLIIAINPILISIFAALIFKEKLTLLKIFGLILSVTGAMVVISNGSIEDVLALRFGKGEIMIGCCVLSWVTYSLAGRTVMRHIPPLTAVCYASAAGTLMLAIPAIKSGLVDDIFSYGPLDWISLFYLGVFGTVLGFWWYYEGIAKIGPAKSSVFINFVPVSAITLAVVLLGESVTMSLLGGGIMVISGVYLTNVSKMTAPAPHPGRRHIKKH